MIAVTSDTSGSASCFTNALEHLEVDDPQRQTLTQLPERERNLVW